LGTIGYYNMCAEELEDSLNQAKDLVIDYLAEQGLLKLNAFTSEDLRKTTMICIKKPSSISRLYYKVFKKEDDLPRMMVVKAPFFGSL